MRKVPATGLLNYSKKLTEVNNMELKMNRADRRKAKKLEQKKTLPGSARQQSLRPLAKSITLPLTRNNRAGARKP
jgi:hypothetical protein